MTQGENSLHITSLKVCLNSNFFPVELVICVHAIHHNLKAKVCGNEYVSQGDIINPENEIF
jgi:hypothetical protein